MRRFTVVLLLVAAFLVLLPVGAARAERAVLKYTWGASAGLAHRNQYLTLAFKWIHPDPTEVRTRMVIFNKAGRRLARTSAVVPANRWAKVKVHCIWRKGRYTVKVYGVDSDGSRSLLYPTKLHFVIY